MIFYKSTVFFTSKHKVFKGDAEKSRDIHGITTTEESVILTVILFG